MILKEHPSKLEEKLFETEPLMIQWLIELRWIALGVALIFCLVGVYIFNIVAETKCYILITIFTLLIGVSNGVFIYLSRRRISGRIQLMAQLASDLMILTALLHHSGSAENPLFMLYVFHVLIASVLLDKRDAYKVTLSVCILFVGLSLLEYLHVLPHYTLKSFPHYEGKHASHDPLYTFGISGVFIVVMFVSAYFATSLAESLRSQIKKQRETASQLIQAAKMSAIGELAGNIAHEINNPISIIIMKTKMLLSDLRHKLTKKVISDIETIDRQAGRIESIVRGLLSFARPAVSKKELIDVNGAIEESLQLIQSRLKVERIALKTDLTNGLPKVVANFNEIQQVVVNIINNAVDAMPDGGELSIRTGLLESSNERDPEGIEIKITDTGRGIHEEHIERIFTPFFTTKGTKGTGLGLTICAGILRNHNGKIWAESEVGKGSTFHIFLPYPIDIWNQK